MSEAPRTIFHVDMDAFYASIEQRDDPSIRGKPVIVGGTARRGVVAAASYEVREFGVHSAMPMAVALRKCPDAIVLPVRMDHYVCVSRELMDVLDGYSPLVEPLSLDEAFLDMTGTDGLFGEPVEAARSIKRAILEVTDGLTCSIGIASNKFLAKLASDMDKPDGITVVPRGREREFIAPLPVRRLWGVGEKTAKKLEGLGLHLVGDVAAADEAFLRRELGSKFARHVRRLANAKDERPVVPCSRRKSVGSETTLSWDIRGRDAVEKQLRRQCERVARVLRNKSIRAASVRVKLRYTETFRLQTRQGPLPHPCDDSTTLFETARRLLDTLDVDAPIRLVGAAAFDLIFEDDPEQLSLFAGESEEQSQLEHTLDEIRDRFGDKIHRGSE